MIPLGNDGNFDADETSLFTGVLYNFYSPPPGFCFDLLCNDEPIKDDPDLEDYNVDKRKAFFGTGFYRIGFLTVIFIVTLSWMFKFCWL